MKYKSLAILFITAALSYAAQVTVRTTVSENSISLHDSIYYYVSIVCQGNGGKPSITPPEMPDELPFRFSGPHGPQTSSSTSVSRINGRTTTTVNSTYIYIFQLQPIKEGKFEIPPLPLIVDGVKYQTDAITINVGVNAAEEELIRCIELRQECDVTGAVPGMPVKLHYVFSFPQGRIISDAFGRYSLIPEIPDAELRQHFRIPDNLDPRSWNYSERTVNGIPCQCFAFDIELTPTTTGEITLPPFKMTFEVPDTTRSNRRQGRRGNSPFDDLFDDPFFSGTPTKRITMASNELTLHVGELPQEGRPDNYSGIIGQITAQVKLSQTEVSVGDPIIAEITIGGPGAVDDAKLPSLKDNSAVTQSFNASGDEEPGRRNVDGTLTFQRTLRAKIAGELAFPSLSIPYYDPADRQYHPAETAPVTVTAQAVRQVTLQDATFTSTAPVPTASPSETPESSADGLAADFSAQELLADSTSEQARMGRSKMLKLLAIPIVAWLICAIVRLSSAIRLLSPHKRSVRVAAQRLKQATSAYRPEDSATIQTLYHAVQEYAVVTFNLAGSSVSAADIEAQPLDDNAKAAWKELLSLVDAACYAGSAASREQVIELVRKIK